MSNHLHKMDQDLALVLDFLPRLWRGMFVKLIEMDFTPDEAMTLLKTYIVSQGPGDKLPPPNPPKVERPKDE